MNDLRFTVQLTDRETAQSIAAMGTTANEALSNLQWILKRPELVMAPDPGVDPNPWGERFV